ncbi:META domain-containing protein [Motilimonas sp. KMU-193]|uniref:META domain-containing protein n=1 Tax=Motilimonas sp. KMU-193 TaxID=3388668 RepID=UPI00396B39F7
MKLRLIPFAAAALVLSACTSNNAPQDLNAADITGQKWHLITVDGEPVMPLGKKTPSLQLDESLKANGIAGCNNFFGQAEWQDGQLKIDKMGMTMMMCPAGLDTLEQKVSTTLNQWSKVSINGNQLILIGNEHTLVYQQAD